MERVLKPVDMTSGLVSKTNIYSPESLVGNCVTADRSMFSTQNIHLGFGIFTNIGVLSGVHASKYSIPLIVWVDNSDDISDHTRGHRNGCFHCLSPLLGGKPAPQTYAGVRKVAVALSRVSPASIQRSIPKAPALPSSSSVGLGLQAPPRTHRSRVAVVVVWE